MPIHRPSNHTLRVLALWGVLPVAGPAVLAVDPPEAPASASEDAWRARAEQAVATLAGLSTSIDDAMRAEFRASVDAALAAEPQSPRWLLGQALLDRADGKTADALATMRRVVALQPSVGVHQQFLGMLLFESVGPNAGMGALGTAHEARDALEKAVALDPSLVWSRYAVCQFYISAPGIAGGSYAKAKGHAKALLAMEDGQGAYMGHLILAMVAQDDENWKAMREEYTLAENAGGIGANPTQALIAHASALLRKKKDAALAAPVLERLAQREDADQTTVQYLEGEAKKLGKDWRGAVEKFEAVLAVKPDARSTRYAIAECYEQLGEKAKAAEHYAVFAETFPSDDRAEKAASKARKLRG